MAAKVSEDLIINYSSRKSKLEFEHVLKTTWVTVLRTSSAPFWPFSFKFLNSFLHTREIKVLENYFLQNYFFRFSLVSCTPVTSASFDSQNCPKVFIKANLRALRCICSFPDETNFSEFNHYVTDLPYWALTLSGQTNVGNSLLTGCNETFQFSFENVSNTLFD